MELDKFGLKVLAAIIYVMIGLVFFVGAFWAIVKASPFSVRKEIEEDQNTFAGDPDRLRDPRPGHHHRRRDPRRLRSDDRACRITNHLPTWRW